MMSPLSFVGWIVFGFSLLSHYHCKIFIQLIRVCVRGKVHSCQYRLLLGKKLQSCFTLFISCEGCNYSYQAKHNVKSGNWRGSFLFLVQINSFFWKMSTSVYCVFFQRQYESLVNLFLCQNDVIKTITRLLKENISVWQSPLFLRFWYRYIYWHINKKVYYCIFGGFIWGDISKRLHKLRPVLIVYSHNLFVL